MNLIQFYIHVNLYLLIFWLAYRACLNRSGLLSASRYYLNGALVVSAALPFFQLLLSSWFQADPTTTLPSVAYHIIEAEVAVPSIIQTESSSGLNLNALAQILFLTGAMLTLLLHLRNHWHLTRLYRNAEPFPHDGAVSVWVSPLISTPFIYGKKILLPSSIEKKNTELVIAHETQHYHYRHYLDMLGSALLQTLFWMNPLFYLLRRELKMIHEYQVDQRVLSRGLDESFYKLSLVRLSVDAHKFRMASGYSKTGLKKRIMMMNDNFPVNKKRILLSPVFLLLLGAAFMTLTLSNTALPQEKDEIAPIQDESISMEIVEFNPSEEGINFREKQDLVILMNKNSRVMINKQKGSLEESIPVLRALMKEKVAPYLDGSRSVENQSEPIFQIFFQRDISADPAKYDQLMAEISQSLLQSRKSLEQIILEQNSEGQADTDVLLPFRIYYSLPEKNMDQR